MTTAPKSPDDRAGRDDEPDLRPVIAWTRCQDKNPAPDDDVEYLVTTVTHDKPHECRSHYGKYVPPLPDDDRPKDHWLVLINGEADQAEWEPPEFYNCSVIAWAEMPRPYIGEDTPSDGGGAGVIYDATAPNSRRARIDQASTGETAIRAAMAAVEAMGADVRLTDAVVLLDRAKDSVADYVDNVPRRNIGHIYPAARPSAEIDDATVERVARAIYDSGAEEEWHNWDKAEEWSRDQFKGFAKAAIAALAARAGT